MKLRHKTVLTIVVIFSCLSMFCIGFANWSVGVGSEAITGSISAEAVMDSSYYISFASLHGSDNTSPFKFDENGFIGSSGSADPFATSFAVTYKFFPGHVCALAPLKAIVTVSLGLTQTDGVNFLAQDQFVSATATYDAAPKSLLGTKWNSEAGTYDVSFEVDTSKYTSGDDSVEITVTYSIQFDAATYKQYVYDEFCGADGGALQQNSAASSLGLAFSASVMDGGAA